MSFLSSVHAVWQVWNENLIKMSCTKSEISQPNPFVSRSESIASLVKIFHLIDCVNSKATGSATFSSIISEDWWMFDCWFSEVSQSDYHFRHSFSFKGRPKIDLFLVCSIFPEKMTTTVHVYAIHTIIGIRDKLCKWNAVCVLIWFGISYVIGINSNHFRINKGRITQIQ